MDFYPSQKNLGKNLSSEYRQKLLEKISNMCTLNFSKKVIETAREGIGDLIVK